MLMTVCCLLVGLAYGDLSVRHASVTQVAGTAAAAAVAALLVGLTRGAPSVGHASVTQAAGTATVAAVAAVMVTVSARPGWQRHVRKLCRLQTGKGHSR